MNQDEKEKDAEKRIRLLVNSLFVKEDDFTSPIDLNVAEMTNINLPALTWHLYDEPCKKMKLLNTGYTIILSAKWFEQRPYISGGALNGNYVFSQIHFHWGATDLEGSEHTVDGTQHPIEMHMVHYKATYLSQEEALKKRDGIVILVYFYKSHANTQIQQLLDAAKEIRKAYSSVRMQPYPLSFMVKPFSHDYFMYWGSITTSTKTHIVLYLVCRTPVGIAPKQVTIFRKLYNSEDKPNLQNFREVQETVSGKNVYHVNPSPMRYATLQPIDPESYLKQN